MPAATDPVRCDDAVAALIAADLAAAVVDDALEVSAGVA